MNTLKPVFFVRSLEAFICPCCHATQRKVIGSRNRKVLELDETSGDLQEKVLRIRRLQCRGCRKIHHELPDILVPYKRHAATTIEAVLEEVDVALETSTIQRLKGWFEGITCHLLGVLHSMDRNDAMEKTPVTGTALQRFRKYVGNASGWLKRIVQSVVKRNAWVQTRSAFAAG